MKTNLFALTVAAGLGLLSFTACNNTATDDAAASDSTAAADAASPITLTPVTNSPEFPDAQLTVDNIKTELKGTDSVTVTFNYGVKNYELKGQTADAAEKGCSNSKDGQHIHFILDNGPYAALYEPVHSFTVPVNSKHYVMSFLSRSYHESVKSPKAAVLVYFSVDEKGKLTREEVPTTPMVFYSRPKGDYLGKDTEKILLDFYVYNATLGQDATVTATINGTEFAIDK